MCEQWSIRSDSEVLLRDVDEFLACYSFSTGETHILDAFPAEIVSYLLSGAKTSSEIKSHLAACMADDGEGWFDVVDRLLTELRDLQLLEAGLHETG